MTVVVKQTFFCELQELIMCNTVHNQDLFRLRRAAFYSQIKSKVGNILAKVIALRINLNINDTSIASRTHSSLLSLPLTNLSSPILSSLFLSIPFPQSS